MKILKHLSPGGLEGGKCEEGRRSIPSDVTKTVEIIRDAWNSCDLDRGVEIRSKHPHEECQH